MHQRVRTRCVSFTLNRCQGNHSSDYDVQFVIIKTKVDEKAGRKVKVSGTIEDLNGTVLVEAS